MGAPPAVVIIARHGARLDAANSQWHLTSPTPYDPPLTYGGWTSSRALGARIASLLHARQSSREPQTSEGSSKKLGSLADGDRDGVRPARGSPRRRRKHKVIIHSSPFLRCIQTSIAISAGIGQHQGLAQNDEGSTPSKSHHLHSGSPHVRAVDHGMKPPLSAIPEPDEDEAQSSHETHGNSQKIKKTHLRVDAFLGEWLSPDYFDLITPPPGSVMMVAGAKADLLRGGEVLDPSYDASSMSASYGNFPGGWGGPTRGTITPSDDEGPLSDFSRVGQALPMRTRSDSHSSTASFDSRVSHRLGLQTDFLNHGGYVPPAPTYTIASSDPIPVGYVQHARDSCVEVDYQWDSMRPPQEWGTGGDYGEEWSSMHKRFRRGLQSMIQWYRNYPTSKHTSDVHDEPSDKEDSSDDDVETDTVLILVTHGAGCNALIGALTSQPVLMDVGMASLTMAVRKDLRIRASSPASPSKSRSRRRSSVDLGVAEDYDVRLTASTEHLRAGANPFSVAQLLSPKVTSPQGSTFRNRLPSTASNSSSLSSSVHMDGDLSLGEPARPMMSATSNGMLHRSMSTTSSHSKSGLWSKPIPKPPEAKVDSPLADKEGMQDGVPTTNGKSQLAENRKIRSSIEDDGVGPLHGSPPLGSPHHGLWGAVPGASPGERDRGLKRRWTVNEHSSNSS